MVGPPLYITQPPTLYSGSHKPSSPIISTELATQKGSTSSITGLPSTIYTTEPGIVESSASLKSQEVTIPVRSAEYTTQRSPTLASLTMVGPPLYITQPPKLYSESRKPSSPNILTEQATTKSSTSPILTMVGSPLYLSKPSKSYTLPYKTSSPVRSIEHATKGSSAAPPLTMVGPPLYITQPPTLYSGSHKPSSPIISTELATQKGSTSPNFDNGEDHHYILLSYLRHIQCHIGHPPQFLPPNMHQKVAQRPLY
ncbi:hypothetical protein LSH36_143g05015 [Paralvinella palmiformis]|uniref:Uncharacterized protein n=1 Tax=Paralvinella palmiformis TaxID=53620 RepID=A0AAD9JXF0_9ANNE|nr:hypothetical protein LSH36_143g05015 [Paralvinella palmiformis]